RGELVLLGAPHLWCLPLPTDVGERIGGFGDIRIARPVERAGRRRALDRGGGLVDRLRARVTGCERRRLLVGRQVADQGGTRLGEEVGGRLGNRVIRRGGGRDRRLGGERQRPGHNSGRAGK